VKECLEVIHTVSDEADMQKKLLEKPAPKVAVRKEETAVVDWLRRRDLHRSGVGQLKVECATPSLPRVDNGDVLTRVYLCVSSATRRQCAPRWQTRATSLWTGSKF